MMNNRILRALLTACLMAPAALAAQTYWRIPAALSGGMLGAGAGYFVDVSRWNASDCTFCGPRLVMTPIGIGAGALLGFWGGLRADQRLARGDSLGEGKRWWLRFSTFIAPVAVGSAAAFAIINPSEPEVCCTAPAPPAVSDETVALLTIGGGAVLGYTLQRRYNRALYPRARVSVLPDRRGTRVAISASW